VTFRGLDFCRVHPGQTAGLTIGLDEGCSLPSSSCLPSTPACTAAWTGENSSRPEVEGKKIQLGGEGAGEAAATCVGAWRWGKTSKGPCSSEDPFLGLQQHWTRKAQCPHPGLQLPHSQHAGCGQGSFRGQEQLVLHPCRGGEAGSTQLSKGRAWGGACDLGPS
jgi:hypothetical protein